LQHVLKLGPSTRRKLIGRTPPAAAKPDSAEQIVCDARSLGLLADTNGVEYVQLKGAWNTPRALGVLDWFAQAGKRD
jgi:hypothetical protein